MHEASIYSRFRLPPYAELSACGRQEVVATRVTLSGSSEEGGEYGEIPVTLGSRQTRYWLPKDMPAFDKVLAEIVRADHTQAVLTLLVNEDRLVVMGLG